MEPPLPSNNTGSPLSNPPRTSGPAPFNMGGTIPAAAIKQVDGTALLPPPFEPLVSNLSELTRDVGDFDESFLKEEYPGDLSFQRDFVEWFVPPLDHELVRDSERQFKESPTLGEKNSMLRSRL